MLADHLFQLLPQLLVLNLTRAAMDSRAFEALAREVIEYTKLSVRSHAKARYHNVSDTQTYQP